MFSARLSARAATATKRVVQSAKAARSFSDFKSVPFNVEPANVPQSSGEIKAPSGIATTTLSNGITVATQNLNGANFSIGVYIRAGSRFENVPGSAKLLELISTISTKNRSGLKIYRDLENAGASLTSKATREFVSFTVEGLQSALPVAIKALSEIVTASKLTNWELSEAAGFGDYAPPQCHIEASFDKLHGAAFSGSTLANSLAPATSVPENLSAFVQNQFVGANIAVVGVNVDNASFVSDINNAFGQISKGVASTASVSKSNGIAIGQGAPTLAIGFHADASTEKARFTNEIIAAALGGVKYVNKAAGVKTVRNGLLGNFSGYTAVKAFNYNGAALVGVATEVSGSTSSVIASVKDAIKSIPKDEKAISAAKAAVASNNDVESARSVRDTIGAEIITFGKATTPEEKAKVISSVSTADIAQAVDSLLKNPNAFAVSGVNVLSFPQ